MPSGIPPSKRESHSCSSWNSKIIIIGGQDTSNYYQSDVHIFDAGMKKLTLDVIFRKSYNCIIVIFLVLDLYFMTILASCFHRYPFLV